MIFTDIRIDDVRSKKTIKIFANYIKIEIFFNKIIYI